MRGHVAWRQKEEPDWSRAWDLECAWGQGSGDWPKGEGQARGGRGRKAPLRNGARERLGGGPM